jgi:hypothetical protein
MWRTSLGRVAEIDDLPQRRLGDLEPRPEQRSQSLRFIDVLDAEPSVDEDQPVRAFDQEAVAAHRRGRQRAACAAKEFPARRT